MTRIALLGCGRWGKLILRDLKSLGCEVHVWAKSAASVKYAEEFGADHIYGQLEEIPAVHGAVIATITRSHFEVIQRFADHQPGVLMFCEKPICTTPKELEFLTRHYADCLFEMHKWRYHPGILKLKEVYQAATPQKLGSLLGIKTARLSGRAPHSDVDAVMILLPHDLSIIYEILGFLPEVQFSRADVAQNQARGIFAVLGTSPWIHMEVSERYTRYERSVTLFFERGVVSFGDSYDEHLDVFYTDLKSTEHGAERILFEQEMPLFNELQSFIEYVSRAKPAPKSNLKDSTAVMQTLFNIRALAGI